MFLYEPQKIQLILKFLITHLKQSVELELPWIVPMIQSLKIMILLILRLIAYGFRNQKMLLSEII